MHRTSSVLSGILSKLMGVVTYENFPCHFALCLEIKLQHVAS